MKISTVKSSQKFVGIAARKRIKSGQRIMFRLDPGWICLIFLITYGWFYCFTLHHIYYSSTCPIHAMLLMFFFFFFFLFPGAMLLMSIIFTSSLMSFPWFILFAFFMQFICKSLCAICHLTQRAFIYFELLNLLVLVILHYCVICICFVISIVKSYPGIDLNFCYWTFKKFFNLRLDQLHPSIHFNTNAHCNFLIFLGKSKSGGKWIDPFVGSVHPWAHHDINTIRQPHDFSCIKTKNYKKRGKGLLLAATLPQQAALPPPIFFLYYVFLSYFIKKNLH